MISAIDAVYLTMLKNMATKPFGISDIVISVIDIDIYHAIVNRIKIWTLLKSMAKTAH